MKVKIFSFFSGAGFLDLGFEQEKYEIVYVNEFNKEFMKAYKFAHSAIGIDSPRLGYYCGDINDFLHGEMRKQLKKNVENMKKEGIVGFIGGPPCPDFSVAGKNMGIIGKNGALTNSYKRIILDQEPDFFVFENVKGLWTTKKHRTEYDKIKASFRRKGYILVDGLVNALDYGVPQERERIILFGVKYQRINIERKIALHILKDNFKFGQEEKFSLQHRKECDWPDTSPFQENSNLVKPINIIDELSVQYWFDKNNVCNHYNSDDFFQPRSRERFETIEEGDVSKKSFKRLHRWRYSPTAAYGNNEVHLHPYYVRRISVAEALAIQSLPKEYIITKELSKSDMFKTIGNGVPFLMAKGIAKAIYDFLDAYYNEEK